MKSIYSRARNLLKEKNAVFGLTSVQAFFAIILGVALLAYVIIVIMGTLQSNSSIFPDLSVGRNNETGFVNGTGFTLSGVNNVTTPGFNNPLMTFAINQSSGLSIVLTNFAVTNGIVLNTTAATYNFVGFNYTYNYNSPAEQGANNIITNTSAGITSFFSSINPVYAILAILVIILVLVVLVRVVTGSTSGGAEQFGRSGREPQL